MTLEATAYARLLRHRWRWVVLGTIIGIVAAFAIAMIRDRPVSASVDVQVPVMAAGDVPSPAELAAGRQRVRTYVALAETGQVIAVVSRQFGLSVDEVRSRVAVLSAPDAAMFRVTVSDPDLLRAAAIAQAVSFTVVAAGRPDGLWATIVRVDEKPQSRLVVLGSAGVAGGIAGFIASVFVLGWRNGRDR